MTPLGATVYRPECARSVPSPRWDNLIGEISPAIGGIYVAIKLVEIIVRHGGSLVPFDLMALRMMLLDLILPQKTLLRGVARLSGMRIVATGLDTIVRWLAL